MPAAPGTKERTRRALLLAGIEVLSSDPSAPLGEVAEQAGVARSTLHRYFPDRASLMSAAAQLADQEYEAAFARARTSEGTALEGFRRLCLELMDALDVLIWWMGPGDASRDAGECVEPSETEASDGAPQDSEVRIAQLVERGHADGTIDPALSALWVENLLWANVYIIFTARQTREMPVAEAQIQALRSLLKAVAADPSSI